MKVFFSILLVVLLNTSVYSQTLSLKDSHQLILVTTASWSSVQGQLQRYERASSHSPWQPLGSSWPIVVGKKGMTVNKQEGDWRTPLGLYELGTLFGFSAKPQNLKMPYLALSPSSVCVDDPQSNYYNQMLEGRGVQKPDWKSAEALATVPLYQWAAVIRYNQPKPQAGKGSCLFLHRWRNEKAGTAGCVAMKAEDLSTLLGWLDAAKKPQLALMTAEFSQSFKKRWDLR